MSLPSAMLSMPLANALAAPPLLPPALSCASWPFRVRPKTGLSVCPPNPHSGTLVLPIILAPAARRWHVIVAISPRKAESCRLCRPFALEVSLHRGFSHPSSHQRGGGVGFPGQPQAFITRDKVNQRIHVD